jgi:hypothetical protein
MDCIVSRLYGLIAAETCKYVANDCATGTGRSHQLRNCVDLDIIWTLLDLQRGQWRSNGMGMSTSLLVNSHVNILREIHSASVLASGSVAHCKLTTRISKLRVPPPPLGISLGSHRKSFVK